MITTDIIKLFNVKPGALLEYKVKDSNIEIIFEDSFSKMKYSHRTKDISYMEDVKNQRIPKSHIQLLNRLSLLEQVEELQILKVLPNHLVLNKIVTLAFQQFNIKKFQLGKSRTFDSFSGFLIETEYNIYSFKDVKLDLPDSKLTNTKELFAMLQILNDWAVNL